MIHRTSLALRCCSDNNSSSSSSSRALPSALPPLQAQSLQVQAALTERLRQVECLSPHPCCRSLCLPRGFSSPTLPPHIIRTPTSTTPSSTSTLPRRSGRTTVDPSHPSHLPCAPRLCRCRVAPLWRAAHQPITSALGLVRAAGKDTRRNELSAAPRGRGSAVARQRRTLGEEACRAAAARR